MGTFPKIIFRVHCSMGVSGFEILAGAKFNYDWDWAGAEKEFRRAREVNPCSRISFRQLRRVVSGDGKIDESVAEIKRINELDPNPFRSAASKTCCAACTFHRKVSKMIPGDPIVAITASDKTGGIARRPEIEDNGCGPIRRR